MPQSLVKFIDNAIDSGLLSSAEVDAFVSSLSAESSVQDGEQLARAMTRAGLLTSFQAKQIYLGKGPSLILGNYVLLDKIGQGGMGSVFKARHRRMDRTVALKVVSPDVVKTDDLLHRFHREVRAAARLNHINIVTAYDADEVNGTHFLVLEYVDGRDLANIVRSRGPLTVEQAVDCALQAARGLHYAHGHGVIHRDIKPGNLLLDGSGTIKILDMGLARFEDAGDVSSADLTETGLVMGTVDYMAPEQAVSTHDADARSDIYSLGITLWFLLTGRPAYEGKSMMARLIAHRDEPIPSLTRHRDDVPQVLDAVFRKMVAKQQADRYQLMGDVIAALSAVLRGEPDIPDVTTPAPDDARLSEFLGGLGSAENALNDEPLPDFVLTAADSLPATQADPTGFFGQADSDTDTTAGLINPQPKRTGNSVYPLPARKRFRWKPRPALAAIAAVVTALAVLLMVSLVPRQQRGSAVLLNVSQPEIIGAAILIDGRKSGTIASVGTPLSIAVDADRRVHRLEVAKHGFRTFTQEFRLAGDAPLPVTVWLEPAKSAAPQSKATSDQATGCIGALVQVLGPEGTVSVKDFIDYDRRNQPIVAVAFNGSWHVTDDALLRLEGLTHLENLSLAGAPVTDAGMSLLSRIPALKVLDLGGTAIADAGIARLISCRKLTVLSLAGTNVSDRGLSNFATFPELQQLNLDGTQVTDTGVSSLADCPQLTSLSLCDCGRVTENVGKSLQHLRHLTQLFLGGHQISDLTVHDLALLDLTYLSMNAASITDAAVPDLSKMQQLSFLSIPGTQLSKAGVARLANALPNCHLETDFGTLAVPRELMEVKPGHGPKDPSQLPDREQPNQRSPRPESSGFFPLLKKTE